MWLTPDIHRCGRERGKKCLVEYVGDARGGIGGNRPTTSNKGRHTPWQPERVIHGAMSERSSPAVYAFTIPLMLAIQNCGFRRPSLSLSSTEVCKVFPWPGYRCELVRKW